MRADQSCGRPSITRRRFLANAGLSIGASALGEWILGCSDYQLEIPCLGPAAAPNPVSGMTYVRASQIGCALDCDLATGRNKYKSGPATDDGPLINQALAAASATNPITLIIDGSALISGLFLPAGGYWNIAGLGCGTGFVIKTGTNNDGIHNGGPTAAIPNDPGPPAPPRGSSVSLRNFTINGNQGDGTNGDSTTGNYRGVGLTTTSPNHWYFSVNLMSLNNIDIENLVIVNSPTYHIRLSNTGNVNVSGCIFKSMGTSTDGIHMDGPANDISISNCNFTTADDSIALNCPEGYSGDILRVTVTNCQFNSWSLMRLYTTDGNRKFNISNVSVSNCSGTLREAAFLIGLYPGANPNSIASLTVTNCNLGAPTIFAMAENFGTLTLQNSTFIPQQTSQIIWLPLETNQASALLRPSPAYDDLTFAGANLTIENCQIIRNSSVDLIPFILDNNSTIANVTVNGLSVQKRSALELINIVSGSIGQLVLDAVDSSKIEAPLSPGGFSSVGSVSGSGVLATGWEFPNSVMANGVPYISACTGQPSIKVNGVVQPYP